MAAVRYSAQEELRKTLNRALIAILLCFCATGVFVYVTERSQRVDREAVAKAEEAKSKTYERFAARVKSLDDYASSLAKEDTSVKAREWMAIGSGGPPPKHPKVLRKPYPTIGQVEQAIGKANSLQAQKDAYHLLPTGCAFPIHVWHMRDPLCHEKTEPTGVESQCERVLLKGAFDKDGHVCYLETYQRGTEDIGRNWGVWTYEIHGNGDQHPSYGQP